MSNITGGCHCGAIRYQVEGDLIVHALCHCSDCRRHAGAPVVGWTMYAEDAVKVTKGQPKVYKSSEHGRRQFCADCGTGLFYINANNLPGIVDIQSATYDDPDAVPAMVHIQTAERFAGWSARTNGRPSSAIRRRVAAIAIRANPRKTPATSGKTIRQRPRSDSPRSLLSNFRACGQDFTAAHGLRSISHIAVRARRTANFRICCAQMDGCPTIQKDTQP